MPSSKVRPPVGTPRFKHHVAPKWVERGHRAVFTATPCSGHMPPCPCHQADVVTTSGSCQPPRSPRFVDTQTCIFQSLERYLNTGLSPQVLVENLKPSTEARITNSPEPVTRWSTWTPASPQLRQVWMGPQLSSPKPCIILKQIKGEEASWEGVHVGSGHQRTDAGPSEAQWRGVRPKWPSSVDGVLGRVGPLAQVQKRWETYA